MKLAFIIIVIALCSAILGAGLGIHVGTVKAYGYFAPEVERRIVRDANARLYEAGVKRFELAVDDGTVMVIPRRKN